MSATRSTQLLEGPIFCRRITSKYPIYGQPAHLAKRVVWPHEASLMPHACVTKPTRRLRWVGDIERKNYPMKRKDCLADPTSENLKSQETTKEDAPKVGTDGTGLSCPVAAW